MGLPAPKALTEEEIGDGITSAIDFDMVMEPLPRPRPDYDVGQIPSVQYYGATGNALAYAAYGSYARMLKDG